jgi:hypothetical protein
MELKIDLFIKEEKSVFRVAVGVLFILISIAWVISRYLKNQYIEAFDWFYCGILFLNGVAHIMGGLGLPIIRAFGESYIRIDEQKLSVKTSVLGKDHSISWIDIKRIDYKLNRFKVIKTNDTTLTLDFSKIEYAILKDAKEIISSIAQEKGILINLY